MGLTLLSEDSQVFGCASLWTHYYLFVDRSLPFIEIHVYDNTILLQIFIYMYMYIVPAEVM